VKLGKRLGRVGFVVGFIGPILFYSVPYTFESPVVCPLCPIVFVIPSPNPLEMGLMVGLLQGLAFAILGFAAGWSISKVRQLT
jgi:hypothetical protein